MLDAKQKQLINAALDDALSPEEQERFGRLLAENAEARQQYEKLRKLDVLLGQMKAEDAPPNLKKTVMNVIRSKQVSAQRRSSRRFIFRPQLTWRQAIVFAAGVATGLILFALAGQQIMNGVSVDRSKVAGSMVPNEPQGQLKLVQEQAIELPGTTGKIGWSTWESTVTAFLALNSTQVEEVELTSRGVVFVGFRCPEGINFQLHEEKRSLRIRHQGSRVYYFEFRRLSRTPVSFRLSLFRKGKQIFQQEWKL